MKFERKTLAIILVATIGLGLFVGLASAAGRDDPFTRILEQLLGIDTKLDTITSNPEKAIKFYENGVVLQPSGRLDYDLLEYEEGKTYHVTLTGQFGSVYDVDFYIFAGWAQYAANTILYLDDPDLETVNLDFVCTSLDLTIINREATQSNAIAIFDVQYETCTNVVNMP